jgi:hypothetical protein
MNLFIKKKKSWIPCFTNLATNIILDQYEIVANKRTGIFMYAAAGYRTRTHRLTGLDVPTTPRRHTFTKVELQLFYYTNGLVTSADISTNSVLQNIYKKKKKKKIILTTRIGIMKFIEIQVLNFKFIGKVIRIERCVSRICMTLRQRRGSKPGLPHGS